MYINENIVYDYISKYVYNDMNIEYWNTCKEHLCKIALYNLGYNIQKLELEKKCNPNYLQLLNDLLYVNNYNYLYLKNHDKSLNLSFKYDNKDLVNFILYTQLYFESILMLLVGVNKLINHKFINTNMLVKYLNQLKEYNVDYIPQIKNKISSYTMSIVLYKMKYY